MFRSFIKFVQEFYKNLQDFGKNAAFEFILRYSRVIFHSNENTNGDGFQLHWKLECGGIFTSAVGQLSSPGYPAGYGPGLTCKYTIQAPELDYVVATFDDLFQLENGSMLLFISSIYINIVVISVCLFACPIITDEPFGWGTRENQGNFLSLV